MWDDEYFEKWLEELQDDRPAAAVMAAEVAPLSGRAAEYYMEGTTHAMVIIGSERAGPAARQIFSAAVMREQVDPV